MNELKVLISSIGSNTAIGVAKSLKTLDAIKLVGIDTNPSNLCPGYAFVDTFIQVPKANDKDYSKVLIQIIEEHNIDCVIPIYDREIEVMALLSERYQTLTKWAVNKESVVRICNDKKQINALLKDRIPVPTVYQDIEKAEFPFIVKPNSGVSSIGTVVIKTANQYVSPGEGAMLVQEFIEGREYTVDCYSSYEDPSIFRYSVRERIEIKSGMSVKGKIQDIPQLGEYCKLIHKILKYRGVSNIQFIEKEGEFFFIEINPRFAGGGILTYISGLNFPLFTVLELTNQMALSDIKSDKLSIGNQMVRYYSETFFDAENHHI